MARKFFFVCAGFLCLVISYQLGYRNAHAQSDGLLSVGVLDTQWSNGFATVVGRTLIRASGSPLQFGPPLPPIPGTASIIAVKGADPIAMLSNGDVWRWDNGGSWVLMGNMIGGATSSHSQSWGAAKVRYR